MEVRISNVDELIEFVNMYYHKFTLDQLEIIFNSFTGWSTFLLKGTTKEDLIKFIKRNKELIINGNYQRVSNFKDEPILKRTRK